MFGFLKKKLSESVEKLSDKIKKKEEEKPVEKPKPKKPVEKLEVTKPPVKKSKRPEKPKPPKVKKKVEKPPEEPKPEERVEEVIEEKQEVIEEEISKPEEKEEPKEEKRGFIATLRRKPEIPKEEKEPEEKPTIRERVVGKVLERKVSEKDIDSLFEEMELGLIEANVAIETIDFLKERMKEHLAGKQLKRGEIEKEIRKTLENILVEIFDQGKVELEKLVKSKRPVSIVFLGFNGSGKTTSIAKLGRYLTGKKFKVVLAAGDTFRAASIEQLEVHGNRLGLKVIKHKYGADSAAVVYDAVEHAKSKGVDFVLADTAGRSHANRDLMDELKKVVRVNTPDLKILVMDSLTGNDLVEQAKKFDEAVGVDAMIFTKVDVNEKGGGMLSACHAVKKPILYIGLGQEYGDIEIFDARKFVKDLMGG
ncbi:MAG: signal recognition particle-docking protein FtsY [Candidatus Aenigmarchaeota archaeon]|nr:signal recognition particle-docking protein FtsY [Candidatus Aenigmarchaeota archaeon]